MGTMRRPIALGLMFALLAGCNRHAPSGFQGYIEGEFVYVASPLAGRLDSLAVEKGTRVDAGAPLFTLERRAEIASQRLAADQLVAATARLEDVKKGSRPTELAALEARVKNANAAAELSRLELGRQETLFKTQVISANEFDRFRVAHERDLQTVAELEAQRVTAGLGARPDAIAAASAEASAAEAAKARADWNVDQKSQSAPKAALVYDTLFRPGEYVTAGTPIVVLLPPENIKVRYFVPEDQFATIKVGDAVQVAIDGHPAVNARVSYLSPKPEYTPPVLYNRENRSKLVFLVEAVFDAAVARDLHPGQPVDVTPAK